jgi:cytochrome c oxidase subunit II
MIEFFVPQGSSFANDIDSLFLFIVVVVGFWFFATMGMFLYLTVRFRARPGEKAMYVTGKEPHLKRWVSVPHLIIIGCDVLLIIGAVKVWYDVKQDLPDPHSIVRVVGQQWAWTFVHPGPDNKLDTDDDIAVIDELHVVKNKTYHFQLESRDVLHSFSIPIFRLKQDALPGRRIMGWFEPTIGGEYDIQCAEMCGIGHGIMGARLFVYETQAEYDAWFSSKASNELAAFRPPEMKTHE